MVHNKQLILIALAVAVLASACASKPFLKVQYQLPSSSTALTGERLSLTISDRRNDDAFLSANAKKSLKNFNGTYSLVVLRDDGSGNLIGAYDLDSLLKEIFKQRLENESVQVIASADNADASLEIQIKEFKLDLVDRKWVLRMSYQASLSKNSGMLAKESVNGSAERLKVMGKSDAEKILGELVTDMVNKLNVSKLFQQAR
ncbi:MAG: hypothetical protein IMF02_13615 [Proteobacteria bacterium]|nr:hypothetical protein [Pseudomonadota bacterium]